MLGRVCTSCPRGMTNRFLLHQGSMWSMRRISRARSTMSWKPSCGQACRLSPKSSTTLGAQIVWSGSSDPRDCPLNQDNRVGLLRPRGTVSPSYRATPLASGSPEYSSPRVAHILFHTIQRTMQATIVLGEYVVRSIMYCVSVWRVARSCTSGLFRNTTGIELPFAGQIGDLALPPFARGQSRHHQHARRCCRRQRLCTRRRALGRRAYRLTFLGLKQREVLVVCGAPSNSGRHQLFEGLELDLDVSLRLGDLLLLRCGFWPFLRWGRLLGGRCEIRLLFLFLHLRRPPWNGRICFRLPRLLSVLRPRRRTVGQFSHEFLAWHLSTRTWLRKQTRIAHIITMGMHALIQA